jgi:hypothetical protein
MSFDPVADRQNTQDASWIFSDGPAEAAGRASRCAIKAGNCWNFSWHGACFQRGMSTAIALSTSPVSASVAPAQKGHSDASDFTFDDLISIVNPLQHIPVVSTIYRSMTGDTIKPFERILGDTLYGGMWGCVSAVANVVYQDVTGKDFGQTVLDFVTGNDNDAQSSPADTAQGSPTAPSTAATATTVSINPSAGSPTAGPASLSPAANGPPRALQSPAISSSTSDAATLALMHALSSKGVDPSLSQRAVSAYKKSLQAKPANTAPPTMPVPTS